tara:strand:+ start:2677 stop:3105 length:429 start_codon:yes stop_codon:yes gene_type:complete
MPLEDRTLAVLALALNDGCAVFEVGLDPTWDGSHNLVIFASACDEMLTRLGILDITAASFTQALATTGKNLLRRAQCRALELSMAIGRPSHDAIVFLVVGSWPAVDHLIDMADAAASRVGWPQIEAQARPPVLEEYIFTLIQ